MYYIPDSNIWIDLSQGKISCNDLLGKTQVKVVVAPLMIVELVRGTIRGGEQHFQQNRAMFGCMINCDILELPKVFIFGLLWRVYGGVSNVRPSHYKILLQMLVNSNSLADFLKKAEAPGSIWKKMSDLDSIHETVLDKELASLNTLAKKASVKTLHVHMAQLYKMGKMAPDPDLIERKFSAALEFLRSSVIQVRNGADPLKNNRGMYVDNQLFYYLADPDAVFVSNEDFSSEIKTSPQKNRIISFAQFRLL
jgi:hypothetical protein